jgi:diadenosine tetraphosphate (Ap4A) HIT family hydrolase
MTCCDIEEVFDTQNNLIKEYTHWKTLVRNRNSTLGNCVVIMKRHVERFADATPEEMTEFQQVVNELENALKETFNYTKINWMMLMMKDKHVHFHVLPRYEKTIIFANQEWEDNAWPRMAAIFTEKKDPIPQDIINQMRDAIKANIQ